MLLISATFCTIPDQEMDIRVKRQSFTAVKEVLHNN